MLKKGVKIGEYKLLELIGSGGFADVWKAEKRTALDVNYFALKFFRPKDEVFDFEKINKEINVWKQLKGLPHIISVTELDQFEDYVYVVSDFAEGGSLENDLIANDGRAKPCEEAVDITLEILIGLENLHEKGFVHRDLKPDNIVILNGKHCLTDFGISRKMKTQSKATGTAGTFEYMPPEAFDKNPRISEATDIWAVGVILQQLLTGELPYPQEDQPSLIGAILMAEPEKLPVHIPQNLALIVKKALEKNSENRFQTAKQMRIALDLLEQSSLEKNETHRKSLNQDQPAKNTCTEPQISKEYSIHSSLKDANTNRQRDLLFEKSGKFEQANADYQAQVIHQSQDQNTNPNLDTAIKKMQEKGILEMKKFMEKTSKDSENGYTMSL